MSKQLRLVYNLFKPWVMQAVLPDGSIKLEGIIGAMVDNITASVNHTYVAWIPSDGLYGHLFENNTWSGMLGALQRQEADLAVGPFTSDYDVFMQFDMMPSSEHTSITALTGMRKAFETKPTPYTRAFEPVTWIFIASSIICLSALITIERLVRGAQLTFWSSSADLFAMCQTLLQESTKDRFTYHFARINGGIWIVGSFILMQLFTQDLKANMVVKAPTMRISSLRDIVQSPWLQIAYPVQSPIHTILETTPGELGVKLRSALRTRGRARNPKDIYHDDIVSELTESRLVIIMEDVSIMYQTSLWCKTTPYFYYMGFENFTPRPALIVMGKHVDPSIRLKVRSKIHQIAAQKVPFVRPMERAPGHFECVPSKGNQRAETTEALTISDLEFPFVSHGIALSACVVALILEILWEKARQRYISRSDRG